MWVHAFSAAEIYYISQIENKSTKFIIEALVEAGLDSIPGAADLLVDDVRRAVSPTKVSTDDWVEIMRTSHNLGLKTSACMMFKKTDSIEDIIEHLSVIRDLQDETGGFTAFICWPFQPDNTRLGGSKVSPAEYLKVLAISRVFLDNIDNIQVSWVTQGNSVGQIGLYYGANDYGSLMIEENVVAAAGISFSTTLEDMKWGHY